MPEQRLERPAPVRIGVIGTGWMGSFHAERIAGHVPNALLAAVADVQPGAAERIANRFGGVGYTDPERLLDDPDVEAVVIASPSRTHAGLIEAAAGAGKAVFCEKPASLTLEELDRAVAVAQRAGVPLQIGFNRRFADDFAAAHAAVEAGAIGTPQLLRSLTRDPALSRPQSVAPWAIFLETLIHDFDTLNWFNPGARAVEVYAVADALVAPAYKERGLLDTSVVTVRYDNGAMAVAEASFQAVYGYDVRGEFFGSAGMVLAGDVRATSAAAFTAQGVRAATTRLNVDLFRQAYTAELVSFADAVRTGTVHGATGADARAALEIALACRASVESRAPVAIGGTERGA